jgi:hypothetical protein
MAKFALLPGGFKPPHAGHYNAAKWLASNTDADRVVVKVGARERDGVTREMSLQLWNLYKDSDPDPLSDKILVQASTSNSPVSDVYDFVEKQAPEGSTVYLGMGEKDISDARFKNIGKFADPKNINFQTVLVPPQAGGVSGTEMRGYIRNDQDTFFFSALPDHMTDMDKRDAWNIVTRKNEMMMGTMTEPEKKKHTKNLKRLKKDLKKQGDQYMKVPSYLKGTLKRKMYENFPPYKAKEVQYTRYRASDVFTRDPDKATKLGYLEEIGVKLKNYKGQVLPGDVIRAPKGFPLGGKKLEKSLILKVLKNSREGVNRYKLSLEDLKTGKKYSVRNFQMDGEYKGEKVPQWSMVRRSKQNIKEGDPKVGTGKKPKGSGRRLYTDENPRDTVKVKFSTRQDIVDTLSKKSFKSKSHKRQSQIINLIHQRVRAAIGRAKDPAVKKRLRSAFEYIKKRKEASKRKTQRMKKESLFSKNWWKDIINEILLTEGGAAGHMAHPFNLSNVNSGRDLKNIFEKAADSLQNNPGSVKIDGVNSSIRLVDLDGKKQFVMDRGSKKPLDIKGITKNDLLARFGDGHGMVKVGGEVLDMFNEALPKIQGDLEKLGALNNPNILFNMEYVSGKTNVQNYKSNFIAIHGLNKIENKEVQGARGPLTKRVSSEVSYDRGALKSLLDNLAPIAKKRGFEVYGSVPTELKKKPNFNAALSKSYTVESSEGSDTKSLGQWLDSVKSIPINDFIFMNIGYQKDSSTINRKKVGAVSKQVYLAILNGENVDGLFENENDRKKAVDGFVTYLATEKLGDEVLKVLDSPMGSVENHEGVVIRDEKISKVPFKITGKFILGGMASDF